MRATLLILAIALVFGEKISAHPIHVSVTNLEFTDDKNIVAVKLFKDDLQLAIYHNFAIEIPLEKIEDEEYTEIINTYLLENLMIKPDIGTTLELELDSSETNDEAIWLYYIAGELNFVSEITIVNSIFLDIYFDQTNLVILNNSGKQSGHLFNYKMTEIEIAL